jgi:alkanesulfonate monooxygenase SsuD/methylene tetrahydromethanopterin reductase-like flavin-dependent oxidoreductase (luciferase family)
MTGEAHLKFGVFYEHQLPRPWTETSELDLLQQSLDQVELADQLGYDYCWEVEHHFLEEYSHSSAPEVFLGAVSQRTKRIRLGHGIMQLTTNQPHRVAEKIATLDLVSRGRVEFGMGEGGGPAELHPFGVQVRSKRDRWIEAVKAIIPMFTKSAWEYHGQFYDFPSRNVLPKPLQKPHPPLWVACTNVKTIEQAAEWGMGALGFSFIDAAAACAWVNKYYNTFIARPAPLTEYKANPNIAITTGFMCAPTDEEAFEKAAGWTFFIFALSHYGRNGIDAPGTGNLWEAYQAWRHTDKAREALATGLIGSPATIRKRLRQYENAHVDQIILLNQAGKTTNADICDSLKLFAEEVMPEFIARHPAHEQWKEEVLAGRIVLDELDTDPHDLYAYQTRDVMANKLSVEQIKERMNTKASR